MVNRAGQSDPAISLRPLEPEDWEILRDMRIKALQNHAGYFGGKAEEAEAYPPEQWQEILDGNGKRVFGLFDAGVLIGIAAIFTFKNDPAGKTGDMGYTYIEPDYRGRGLVDMLYDARIKWALEHTAFTKIVTAHRVTNIASQRAITRNGFTYVDTITENWPDDTTDDELRYELDLMALREKNN